MNERQHDEIRELIAPYVLGAVTPEEDVRVRTHLLSCDDCRTEMERFREVETALAHSVGPLPLPEGFADHVLADAQAAATRDAPSESRASKTTRYVLVASFAAMIITIGILAGGLIDIRRDQARQQQFLHALLRGGITLTNSSGAIAKMVADDQGSLFVAAGLPPAPQGRTYQLWIVKAKCSPDPCPPMGAGTFDAEEPFAIIEVGRPLESVGSLAVTIEPDGGSDQPTSTPVLRSA